MIYILGIHHSATCKMCPALEKTTSFIQQILPYSILVIEPKASCMLSKRPIRERPSLLFFFF